MANSLQAHELVVINKDGSAKTHEILVDWDCCAFAAAQDVIAKHHPEAKRVFYFIGSRDSGLTLWLTEDELLV